jgi:hypothetical protein
MNGEKMRFNLMGQTLVMRGRDPRIHLFEKDGLPGRTALRRPGT